MDESRRYVFCVKCATTIRTSNLITNTGREGLKYYSVHRLSS